MYAAMRAHRTGTHSPALAQGLAVFSLGCGALGFFVLSLLLGPLAILTGYLALLSARPFGARGRGERRGIALAKAGIVLGAVVLALYAVLLTARS
ncbi:DUF4190 domain-containing protein [Streptomyces sp. NPDC057638]|uniref:DUF4190 domain-containing protein n=1 Tax=Streptomyces sp. NPDC057638 TaxID=3346190 RepID=UPI0036A1CB6F